MPFVLGMIGLFRMLLYNMVCLLAMCDFLDDGLHAAGAWLSPFLCFRLLLNWRSSQLNTLSWRCTLNLFLLLHILIWHMNDSLSLRRPCLRFLMAVTSFDVWPVPGFSLVIFASWIYGFVLAVFIILIPSRYPIKLCIIWHLHNRRYRFIAQYFLSGPRLLVSRELYLAQTHAQELHTLSSWIPLTL